MMKIRKTFLLGFIGIFVQDTHSMSHGVGSQLVSQHDTLSKKYSSTKLNVYYTNISDLSKKPVDTNNEVVGVLNDALQNITDAFQIIDTKWVSHSDIRESAAVQKGYCKRVLYDLYWSLHEKFEDINSPEATHIREELRNLGIIE